MKTEPTGHAPEAPPADDQPQMLSALDSFVRVCPVSPPGGTPYGNVLELLGTSAY